MYVCIVEACGYKGRYRSPHACDVRLPAAPSSRLHAVPVCILLARLPCLSWHRCPEQVIDIDARDFTGVTALWLAANHHYPDVIVALLKAGAKTHFRDRR